MAFNSHFEKWATAILPVPAAWKAQQQGISPGLDAEANTNYKTMQGNAEKVNGKKLSTIVLGFGTLVQWLSTLKPRWPTRISFMHLMELKLINFVIY